jgi:hypothetical protein
VSKWRSFDGTGWGRGGRGGKKGRGDWNLIGLGYCRVRSRCCGASKSRGLWRIWSNEQRQMPAADEKISYPTTKGYEKDDKLLQLSFDVYSTSYTGGVVSLMHIPYSFVVVGQRCRGRERWPCGTSNIRQRKWNSFCGTLQKQKNHLSLSLSFSLPHTHTWLYTFTIILPRGHPQNEREATHLL